MILYEMLFENEKPMNLTWEWVKMVRDFQSSSWIYFGGMIARLAHRLDVDLSTYTPAPNGVEFMDLKYFKKANIIKEKVVPGFMDQLMPHSNFDKVQVPLGPRLFDLTCYYNWYQVWAGNVNPYGEP